MVICARARLYSAVVFAAPALPLDHPITITAAPDAPSSFGDAAPIVAAAPTPSRPDVDAATVAAAGGAGVYGDAASVGALAGIGDGTDGDVPVMPDCVRASPRGDLMAELDNSAAMAAACVAAAAVTTAVARTSSGPGTTVVTVTVVSAAAGTPPGTVGRLGLADTVVASTLPLIAPAGRGGVETAPATTTDVGRPGGEFLRGG
jgi:hypothetical protein